jgi:hypothetical protein
MRIYTFLILGLCMTCSGSEFTIPDWDMRIVKDSPELKLIQFTKTTEAKLATVKSEVSVRISGESISWAQNIFIGKGGKFSQVAFNSVIDGGKTLVKWTVCKNPEYLVSIGKYVDGDLRGELGQEYLEIKNLTSDINAFERYTFTRGSNGIYNYLSK